jgi:hypothetical protein
MNRFEWILSGLLAVLLVVAVVMLLLFWNEQRQEALLPATAAGSSGSGQAATPESGRTALSAYHLAQPVAQDWAEDARLLTASATWPAGQVFPAGAASWGLVFYSPGRPATALISVANREARLVRSSSTEKTPQPVDTENWQVDSPAVVEQLLSNGGQAFVDEHGQVSLALTLNTVGELSWQAKLVDTESFEAFTLQFDPITGTLLATPTP